jgi:UDP-N-acetylglucosamine diphosphorylase/glucosamine-1-phosphate N-acetyltransferase
LGEELQGIIDKVASGHIAVKGGYVVAARLPTAPARDFAAYLRKRISEETIVKLCEELRELAESGKQKRSSRRKALAPEHAGEGTYEDVHAVGQDAVAEKPPVELTNLIAKHGVTQVEMPEARLLSFPWQLIEFNPQVIEDDFRKLPFRGQSEECVVYPGVQITNEENVLIGERAVIKSGVVIDATDGPVTIGDGAVVMPNAALIGPVSIGAHSIIKPLAQILPGTSVGEVCKIGGEVGATVFGNYTNKQHDGYFGHSYLGEWVNIGAASTNSDLKNNYSHVRMWCAGAIRETGRQFLGTIIGDHTKTGVNTLFTTGAVVGFSCNLFGSGVSPKFVPSFSWGQGENLVEYDLARAMQTAEVVLDRRKVKFERAHRALFKKIFDLSLCCNRNL